MEKIKEKILNVINDANISPADISKVCEGKTYSSIRRQLIKDSGIMPSLEVLQAIYVLKPNINIDYILGDSSEMYTGGTSNSKDVLFYEYIIKDKIPEVAKEIGLL